MMANTYILIGSTTVGAGGVTSVTFSSIPNIYTDLKLVVSARNTDSGRSYGTLQVNGNSSSIYSDLLIYGSGSSVGNQIHSSGTYITTIPCCSSTDTANTFGNSEIYFPNYLSANNKSMSIEGTEENNAAAGYDYLVAGVAATSSPITSITVIAYTGAVSWVQYSTFYLYGIKNS